MQALPWSLAIGDIEENLEGLLQEADVHDLTAHKILQLLRLGWNRQQIKDAIMLFRDVHWSTLGVEQAHGSAAVMHRHHTFSTDMLAARSFLHHGDPAGAAPEVAVRGLAATGSAGAEDPDPGRVAARRSCLSQAGG